MNRFVPKLYQVLNNHSRVCMYNFIMFDRLFLKLERQDQGRGPNQKCVKITFNLPLVNTPINALHLCK